MEQWYECSFSRDFVNSDQHDVVEAALVSAVMGAWNHDDDAAMFALDRPDTTTAEVYVFTPSIAPDVEAILANFNLSLTPCDRPAADDVTVIAGKGDAKRRLLSGKE